MRYPTYSPKNEARSALNIEYGKSKSLYLIYASQFAEYQHTIEKAKATFAQDQIWPDQCEYLIHKIKPIQKSAASIANFVNSTRKQGGTSSRYNGYPLLVHAHYFCEQVETLIAFIREYKEIAENRSTRRSKQKLIMNSLHGLDSSLQDLMQELDKTM